jgi:coproporphyrinogen III oxidase-like Fe-S oxidoreductase
VTRAATARTASPAASAPWSTLSPVEQIGFGVYVHIPFCRHKCDYCAFATFTDRAHLVERYLAALRVEIERAAASPGAHTPLPAASTIFVGGGTPSLVDPQALVAVLDAIPRRDDAEFTIECNPDDVTVEMLRTFRSIGVNRISLGMQSAREHVLLSLGRTHTPTNVQSSPSGLRTCRHMVSRLRTALRLLINPSGILMTTIKPTNMTSPTTHSPRAVA